MANTVVSKGAGGHDGAIITVSFVEQMKQGVAVGLALGSGSKCGTDIDEETH